MYQDSDILNQSMLWYAMDTFQYRSICFSVLADHFLAGTPSCKLVKAFISPYSRMTLYTDDFDIISDKKTFSSLGR